MSISVEGQKCPVCKSYMFDDEEIVFCPVCGQPSHKECYNRVGKCPLEEYHGTDMQYKKPETAEEAKEPPKEPDINNEPPQNFRAIPFTMERLGAVDPYGGVDQNTVIEDEITAKEVKDAVAVNTQYYIPKFLQINKNKKTSWNFAAFLIPESYFFFRKCYKVGFLAFMLSVISLALLNYPLVYLTITENTTTSQMVMQLMNTIMASNEKMLSTLIFGMLGLAISLISRIIFGLFANSIYKKEVINKIKECKKSDEDTTLLLKLKGGINPFLGLFGLMGVNYVVNLLFGLFM